ncbi:MAG TPA: PLP-dependent aminotransferase family protein [Hyphomicrobiaceae bacterium]|nr:PLP-dependent aminotransferase family protein [Hyphomicrobiaceae bacterium]
MFEPRYARRAEAMRASEIRELLKLLEKPGIISFAGGIPDPALFPRDAAAAAYAQILADPVASSQGLQYSVSEGYPPLRAWIARHMSRLGVPARADNILVTSGSQQALEFLGKLFITAGDTALVTAPTYLGALQAFSAYEPRYDTLRPESGNRTPASYAEAAALNGGSVKFAYVVPDFANPTGETLTADARHGLIALAEELDCPIIEDTAYVDLRFAGESVPAIQALDVERHGGDLNASRVIYCGTFSKTLTPGLRIGWVCAAESVVRRLTLIKQASDLNCSLINQMVMERLAVETYDAQVAKAGAHYRARRDAMLAALKANMPAGVTWTTPEGGLFIWVTLPRHMDGAEILQRAIVEAEVAFVPGGAFFTDGSGKNTMRLSYSLPSEAQITQGIARLGKLIASL